MNEELTIHSNEEKKLNEFIQKNEETEKTFSKIIESFNSQVNELNIGKEKMEKMLKTLDEEKEKREKIFNKYRESNQKYVDYQITLKMDSNKLEEFKNQKHLLEKENSELLSKRNLLELKLPNLENEKQSMVKARNFKVCI